MRRKKGGCFCSLLCWLFGFQSKRETMVYARIHRLVLKATIGITIYLTIRDFKKARHLGVSLFSTVSIPLSYPELGNDSDDDDGFILNTTKMKRDDGVPTNHSILGSSGNITRLYITSPYNFDLPEQLVWNLSRVFQSWTPREHLARMQMLHPKVAYTETINTTLNFCSNTSYTCTGL